VNNCVVCAGNCCTVVIRFTDSFSDLGFVHSRALATTSTFYCLSFTRFSLALIP
jgi:hypothetical protein